MGPNIGTKCEDMQWKGSKEGKTEKVEKRSMATQIQQRFNPRLESVPRAQNKVNDSPESPSPSPTRKQARSSLESFFFLKGPSTFKYTRRDPTRFYPRCCVSIRPSRGFVQNVPAGLDDVVTCHFCSTLSTITSEDSRLSRLKENGARGKRKRDGTWQLKPFLSSSLSLPVFCPQTLFPSLGGKHH